MLKFVRYSSTLCKLWVKHNGGQPTQVSTAGCLHVSDFIKAIKRDLSPKFNSFSHDQLTLYKTLTDVPIRPGLPIFDLLNSLDGNTDEKPLFVKTQATDTTTTSQKTIFVQEIDEDCIPIDSFKEIAVETDSDLKQIFEGKGSALLQLSNPSKLVTKFKQLIDREKYKVYSRYERSFVEEERWQQMEDKAMEEEVYMAVKRFLGTQFGTSIEELVTDIVGSDGNIAQEWDAIFKNGNVVYLCEAKHNMSLIQVNKLPQRIKKFKELSVRNQPELRDVTNYVGVLCGTFFPKEIRKSAHNLGFICVYPSGHRYDVQNPPKEFIIEH